MSTPSPSTTKGWRQPNSRIDAATAATASSFTRGFRSYGFTRSMGHISICMERTLGTGLCWWLRDAECGPGNPGRRAGEPESACR